MRYRMWLCAQGCVCYRRMCICAEKHVLVQSVAVCRRGLCVLVEDVAVQ